MSKKLSILINRKGLFKLFHKLNFFNMKKLFILLTVLLCLQTVNTYGQFGGSATEAQPTSIGMVIYSNDIETLWNALRLANFSKNTGDTVTIFLLGKGVELDTLVKINMDLKEQADMFLNNGGKILGCGTCLQSRKFNEPQVCKFSTMADLYEIIRKNQIILTF